MLQAIQAKLKLTNQMSAKDSNNTAVTSLLVTPMRVYPKLMRRDAICTGRVLILISLDSPAAKILRC